MKRNLGRFDRMLRVCASCALTACALLAPLPLVMRVLVFGVPGCYMLLSALAGTCLGYSLLGLSTCSTEGALAKGKLT